MRILICDECGCRIINGRELVLSDSKWDEIVKKSRSQKIPKRTLLCPECIERLNGGKIEFKDLLQVWSKDKTLAAVPINYWYMRLNKMLTKENKPYILKHIRLYGTDVWKSCRKSYQNLKENGLLKRPSQTP